jgi:hypothetical protein
MSLARGRSATASSNILRAWRAVLLAALVAAHPRQTFADAPVAETRRLEPRVVVLDAAPGDGVDRELEATLGELLGRLHVGLVRADGVGGARVVARVHIESSERGALLTVESDRHDVAPVRREIERGDSTALFRETLAHVILGAVEPLVGRDDEAERAPPAPPPPPIASDNTPPRTSEPARDPMRLSVGAGAGPRLLEADRAGIAFAGTVSLALPAPLRPMAGLGLGYVLPARVSSGGVDAEFHLVPLRADAGIQPVAWKTIALETALVAGVDFVSLAPERAPSYVRLEDTSRRRQPVLGAVVRARFRLSPSADFVLTAGLDVDMSPRRWVIVAGQARDGLFETTRFRPYASLGLDFAMLGVSPATSREGSP